MKNVNESKHTFAVCAYKESPYLDACIQSLLDQSVKSKIMVVTSTPNEYILNMVKKYQFDYYINDGEKGIIQDWNYAYGQAKTKYVTLAHQDDVYAPNYTEEILKQMDRSKNPIIAFTDYSEIRKDKLITNNTMLKIKRIMLLPLRLSLLQRSKFVRRRILSFGCPICCPSVTYHKENLPEEIFEAGYRSDEDWQAWEKLSHIKGEFVYCSKALTFHRIHQESETTAIIGDNIRTLEDYDMFRKFWPDFIARKLTKWYSNSEKSNQLD